MKKVLLLLCLCCIPVIVLAQDDVTFLNVENPQFRGNIGQGTIEEATFSVRPKGVYTEIGVYLTFSARGSQFGGSQQLEVIFNFTLPEGAAITDSWLWVGQDIVRAILIERGTATDIYEGIVNTRRDPSLLVKNGEGQYELRVFPMRANETRKVKITYLVPNLWLAEEAITSLPFDWLDASLNPLETMDVLAWPEQGWEAPVMTEAPDLTFDARTDQELGPFSHLVLDRELIESLESIAYDTPMENGVYLSTYDLGGSGWYQLAYLPSASLETGGNKKAIVLIDHDASKTSLTGTALIERARASLKASLTPADSFNVVVSRLDVDPVSANWLPATPEQIDAVFDEIAASSASLYSNLPSLLASGISFIAAHGNDGEILLISSGDAIADVAAADQLIVDLQAVTSPLPPVHIADVANRNISLNVDVAGVFEGNEYLYGRLADVSGGRFLDIRSGRSYDNIVRDLLSSLGETILNPELFTTSTGGFTFGRFTSVSDSEAAPTTRAITQIGNFLGFSPFSIEASGTYRGEAFTDQIQLGDADTYTADQSLEAFWTGQQIRKLELLEQDEDQIAEIVEFSFSARVLSIYTAYLALEPGVQGTEPCTTCEDETTLVSIEDEALPTGVRLVIEVYPNPFADRVVIRIEFPEPTHLNDHTFTIYNMMGQKVKTFDVGARTEQLLELEWDGTNDSGEQVTSGVYFFVMESPTEREMIKIVRVR